ncbi:MAG: hypothetical protein V1867_08315 [Candidatus Falkowbacteria bacterium]
MNAADTALVWILVIVTIGIIASLVGIKRTKRRIKEIQQFRKVLTEYKDFIFRVPLVIGCGESTLSEMRKKAEFTLVKGENLSDYCIWVALKDSYPYDFNDTDKYPRIYRGYRVFYEVSEESCYLSK